ncbi:MAG TPA: potassium-transporting ATPase subunit KdpB, partial [Steroidobacteraceae bacterium]|nr:potassium-transporting ATPase subunit KdpB [Steroidobacteraceae bacterium]
MRRTAIPAGGTPAPSGLDRRLLLAGTLDSLRKLDPRVQLRNPVMFVVFVCSILTTLVGLAELSGAAAATGDVGFVLAIAAWLWLTVLFANFAEAVAEGRGKAQAAALRATRRDVQAKKLAAPRRDARFELTPATVLRRGDHFLVEAQDVIAADGEVVAGVASVDESAITGESAPVLREAGSDFSSVTGGTRVLSDWLVVRVTSDPGETFLDRMIAMVEGARRGRTPNEIALSILLAALTLVFLLATATLAPFSAYAVAVSGGGQPVSIAVLAALLVCLIPTTIGGLLSAIGIAGMDRLVRANVIATSGRAVETAGDVDVLLLDKTGTITLGDRQAYAFHPAPGVHERELADVAQLASLSDETPEGRSIVVLAKQRFQLRGRDLADQPHVFHKFTAKTRTSGVDFDGRRLRKGATDAIRRFVAEERGAWPSAVTTQVEDVARRGATPLVVAEGARVLGVV